MALQMPTDGQMIRLDRRQKKKGYRLIIIFENKGLTSSLNNLGHLFPSAQTQQGALIMGIHLGHLNN